jgi:uncharacterized protein
MKEYEVVPSFDELVLSHGSYPVVYKEPFVLTVSSSSGRLLIGGRTEVRLEMPCDRCLKAMEIPFSIVIDVKVSKDRLSDGASNVPEGDSEIDDVDEFSFLDGCILDVDKLVSDEIVVALPTKVLCKDDCKGLCPVCGKNLNYGSCSCDRSVGDPRMAAIRDIFREFNS